MITFEEALHIHDVLIDEFGGSSGLRDTKLLKSALARPEQTFDGKDLYSSPIEKAAAILESIVVNHPFIDGNKRTGYTLFRLYLLKAGLDIVASQDEKYDLVISIADGTKNIDHIIAWSNEKVKHAT
jgi:death-on-curing protein